MTKITEFTERTKLEVVTDAASVDQSTGLSWLWFLLFGPFWALYIGAPKWALISLLANFVTMGFASFVLMFFAYAAHRNATERRVEKATILAAARATING